MPVFNISDGAGNLQPLAREEVLARMAYPADEKALSNYRAWMVAAGLAAIGGTDASVPIAILRNILLGPSYEQVTEDVNKQHQHGYAAARLLDIILACNHHHPQFKPSVSKAWDVVSHVYGEAQKDKKRRFPYSIAYLKKQWVLFKPVVHLWSAFLLSSEANWGTLDADIWLPGAEHERLLPNFLAVAEKIRKQAQLIFAHGKTSPVLEPEVMWTVPQDLPLPRIASFKPAPLSKEMLDFLAIRRAPRHI